MAVLVEHDKRKREILEKSLDLFIEEGYEDVTFQKIADRCGITRTTLYIYFKNKREIFLWSIKQLTGTLEDDLKKIILEGMDGAALECLRKILYRVVEECEKNSQLFKVLLGYLIQVQKNGVDPDERVTRRVIRMQHLMSTVVIRGQRSGEIKNYPVKDINDQLYSILETGIFRIAVLDKSNLDAIRRIIDFSIEELRA